MKRIITEMLVPDWVEWTAEDAFGMLLGYAAKPKPCERSPGRWQVQWPSDGNMSDQCIVLSQIYDHRYVTNPDWERTVKRVQEVAR